MSALICSASRLGPVKPSSQSSAYAEVPVMPRSAMTMQVTSGIGLLRLA
jgi:hypothetical protein